MPSRRFLPLILGVRLAILSLNRLEVIPHNITSLNRDIRVIGDIRERTPYR